MKALLVQKDVRDMNFKSYLDYAQSRKVELVCFGELANSGCLYGPRPVPPIEPLLKMFSEYSLRVLIGAPLQTGGGIYNSLLYFHQGTAQYYRKRNLFPGMDEPKTFLAGTEPGFFETDFGKVGAAICYDLRFPEIFSDLKTGNTQLVFLPAAWPRVRIHDWKRLIAERAQEYGLTIVGINAVGDDGTNVFGGSTMVVDRAGSIVAQADEITPTVLEVHLPSLS